MILNEGILMDWIEILKYALPAITALIATGITLYYQYKLKKVELEKQNEFRARESLFNFKNFPTLAYFSGIQLI